MYHMYPYKAQCFLGRNQNFNNHKVFLSNSLNMDNVLNKKSRYILIMFTGCFPCMFFKYVVETGKLLME